MQSVLGAYRRVLANRRPDAAAARGVHLVHRGLALPGRAADHHLRPHRRRGAARRGGRGTHPALRVPVRAGGRPGRPGRPAHDPAGHRPGARRLHAGARLAGGHAGPHRGDRRDHHPGDLLLLVLRAGDRLLPAEPGPRRGGSRTRKHDLRHAGEHRVHRRSRAGGADHLRLGPDGGVPAERGLVRGNRRDPVAPAVVAGGDVRGWARFRADRRERAG